MAKTQLKFLLLCIYILLATTKGDYNQCVTSLRNTVVYEGTLNTMLDCSAGPNGSAWVVRPTTNAASTSQITNYDDTVSPTLTNLYAYNQSGLIVRSATSSPTGGPMSTAGVYIVNFNTSANRAAKLVVIRSAPICSCNQFSSGVNLTCTITYADHPIAPIFPLLNCKADDQLYAKAITTKTPSTSYVNTYTLTITVNNSVPAAYDCVVTLSALQPNDAATYPFLANNAPDFSATFTVCAIPSTTKAPTVIQPSTTAIKPLTIAFNFFVEPIFGPIAGGTNVTVACQWSDVTGTISAVYFGSHLLGQNLKRSGPNFTILTPPVDDSAIGQPLPITVQIYPGSYNVSTNTFFTYAPNPKVDDVNPKMITLSGGIRLNVLGSNLLSVARPILRALVVVKRIDGSSSNNESFAPCEPATDGGTKMVCLSPPIYIPDDFLAVIYGKSHSPYSNAYRRRRETITEDLWYDIDSMKANSRRRRQTDAKLSTKQTYYGKNGQDSLIVHIGAKFDGYLKYSENILRDNPAQFEIFFPPNLTCPEESVFEPTSYEFIKIKGEGMSRCCYADSYVIRLGNNFCNVTDLTDNQLTCRPPRIKPEQTTFDVDFCGQNIAILVNVGYWKYKCSCLKYTSASSNTRLIIIVVATVGSSLIFIIVIVLACVISKRIKNSKKTTTEIDNDSSHDLQTGLDYIYPSGGDRHRWQPYNGQYATTAQGSDHSGRYNGSNDDADYVERSDEGSYRNRSYSGNDSVRGSRRNNLNEDGHEERGTNDEPEDDFYYRGYPVESLRQPRRYFNDDRSYRHRTMY